MKRGTNPLLLTYEFQIAEHLSVVLDGDGGDTVSDVRFPEFAEIGAGIFQYGTPFSDIRLEINQVFVTPALRMFDYILGDRVSGLDASVNGIKILVD